LKSRLRTQTTILERIKNLKLLLRTETPTCRELRTQIWGKNWNSTLKIILGLGYYFDHVLNFELAREIMKVHPPKKKNPATR
jgi:hypothetical protein